MDLGYILVLNLLWTDPVNEGWHERVKSLRVKEAMKDYGLRFHKINRIPMNGNKPRSLVLRQRLARTLLGAPKETTYIVLDETWIGSSDHRRASWHMKDQTNSVPALQMAPRISMMAACSSKGDVWISLLQCNSNRQTFSMFLRLLVLKLD